jgi:predicted dinucleotide-binding enzyme
MAGTRAPWLADDLLGAALTAAPEGTVKRANAKDYRRTAQASLIVVFHAADEDAAQAAVADMARSVGHNAQYVEAGTLRRAHH